MTTDPTLLVLAIQEHLSDDLRREPWKGNPNPLAGHCYVASETLWHLLGGRASGYTPAFVRWEDSPHWFLRDAGGKILDPTADQFETLPDYSLGVNKGFLTRHPSLRSTRLMGRVLAAHPPAEIIPSLEALRRPA